MQTGHYCYFCLLSSLAAVAVLFCDVSFNQLKIMENILLRDFSEIERGSVKEGSNWSSVDHIRLLLGKMSDLWLMKINYSRNEKTYKLRLGSFYLMIISDVTLAFALFGEILLRSGHITHFIVPLLLVTCFMFVLIMIIKVSNLTDITDVHL